jgi:hypothetical protein
MSSTDIIIIDDDDHVLDALGVRRCKKHGAMKCLACLVDFTQTNEEWIRAMLEREVDAETSAAMARDAFASGVREEWTAERERAARGGERRPMVTGERTEAMAGAGESGGGNAPAAPCANAACGNEGTKRCGVCKKVRYCSRECQMADWTNHRGSCAMETGATDESMTSTKKDEDAEVDETVSMMAGLNCGEGWNSMQLTHILPETVLQNMMAGSSGGWYAGLTKRRVYERFVLSFCLRVDDEYTCCGNAHGVLAYAAENDGRVPAIGDRDSSVMKEFRAYLELAKRKNLLPKDWARSDDEGVFEYALQPAGVRRRWRDVAIVNKWGHASGEHMILRSLADSVLGRSIGSWM